jgi:transcriptional regulator with XRE-family HTH domain
MVKKMRFSDQLRRAVEQSDLTRYQISKRTGIAQSILSRFINQGAGLSMESTDRLCDCLRLRLVAEDQPRKRKGR